MEWSKIKNIILVILLFVNGFLLLLVGGQQLQERYSRRATLQNAARVLEQNGIVLSNEGLVQLSSASLAPMTAGRDLAEEDALARRLLGEETVCTDQSGGVYLYTSPMGTAVFRAGGECRVSFSSPIPVESFHADHALNYMTALSLEGEVLSNAVKPDGTTVITLHQLLHGHPLYTCRVEFTYSPEGLTEIRGSLLLSPGASAPSGDTVLDTPTALIRFLSGILDSGDLCSAITSVRPGYLTVSSFGSAFTLRPVWLVTTNVAQYYLDCTTGTLSRVS